MKNPQTRPTDEQEGTATPFSRPWGVPMVVKLATAKAEGLERDEREPIKRGLENYIKLLRKL